MDLKTFAAFHLPALEAEEVTYNVQIAVIEAALRSVPDGFAYWSLGPPGHCAIQSPGRNIVLGMLDADELRAFALETRERAYPGVMGEQPLVSRFIKEATDLGMVFDEPVAMRSHILDEAPVNPGAAGEPRGLEARDAELLFRWMVAFHREAVPHEPPPKRDAMESAATCGRYLFWCVDGEPVSVACINRTLRSVSAIGAVYTPPELRGKGYAGSVVAACAERIFASGKRAACLFTDLSKPASNRCYAKIGFKPYGDAANYMRLR